MTDIRMFRTISGEDVIAEFVETNKTGDVYKNAIQLVIVPKRSNPEEQSYAFAPFPQYAQQNTEGKITFNTNLISFFIDIDEQFLEQYNSIFGIISAPAPKIII